MEEGIELLEIGHNLREINIHYLPDLNKGH